MAGVVLLIEDDDAARDSLARLLKARGYSVVPLATARDCMTVLDFMQPRYVVLDFRLPDGDAITLVERARALAPNCRLVMISGFTDAAETAAAHAVPFLAKPVDIDALVRALHAA